jgi:hypothetical protein
LANPLSVGTRLANTRRYESSFSLFARIELTPRNGGAAAAAARAAAAAKQGRASVFRRLRAPAGGSASASWESDDAAEEGEGGYSDIKIFLTSGRKPQPAAGAAAPSGAKRDLDAAGTTAMAAIPLQASLRAAGDAAASALDTVANPLSAAGAAAAGPAALTSAEEQPAGAAAAASGPAPRGVRASLYRMGSSLRALPEAVAAATSATAAAGAAVIAAGPGNAGAETLSAELVSALADSNKDAHLPVPAVGKVRPNLPLLLREVADSVATRRGSDRGVVGKRGLPLAIPVAGLAGVALRGSKACSAAAWVLLSLLADLLFPLHRLLLWATCGAWGATVDGCERQCVRCTARVPVPARRPAAPGGTQQQQQQQHKHQPQRALPPLMVAVCVCGPQPMVSETLQECHRLNELPELRGRVQLHVHAETFLM